VFDFETTGLDPINNDVIQISAIKFKGAELDYLRKESFNRFLKVGYTIPPEVVAIHGISNQVVDDMGVSQQEGWEDFASFIDNGLPLVGHNIVNFDCKFLESNFNRLGLRLPDTSRYFDTAMIYKGKKINQLPMQGETHLKYCQRIGEVRAYGVKFNLGLCCDELGIDRTEFTAHRADGDVEMTNLIFLKSLEEVS
jgi:DNA polymerase III epsilon subunit-like protein